MNDHVSAASNALLLVVTFYANALQAERAYSKRLEEQNAAIAQKLAETSAKLVDAELDR